MSLTNFYLVAGGGSSLDTNAGSSRGARQANTTGGTWVGATNTFTAAGGTPFAATVAGDYASVYPDGNTVTGYVAKVQTVTSSTVIVLDGTIVYGTKPADGTNTRSCSINGAWATEQVLAAGGLGTFTVPQSTKINITGNLTLAADRTISIVGTTTLPLWLSGYNTNPGDLDNDTTNTLAKPIWTRNGQISMTGAFQLWSGLSFTGSNNGPIIRPSVASIRFSRCRAQNTNAGTAARAVDLGATGVSFAYCYFKSPATTTANAIVDGLGGTGFFVGCVFDTGGKAGVDVATLTGTRFVNCVFINNVAGIIASTGFIAAFGCTFCNATDGVKWSGAPGGSSIIGCLFSTLTNGINNSTGTNTANIWRACNDYYAVTNPEVGMGDWPAFFGQTDTSNPLISASNLTPIINSNAWKNGFPGIFENETFSSYQSIGAVTPLVPAGLFIQ